MRRRAVLLLALLLLVLAGAVVGLQALGSGNSGPATHGPNLNGHSAPPTSAAPAANPLLVCRVIDDATGLAPDGATCRFQFGSADVTLPATGGGAQQRLLPGSSGKLTGAAPGYVAQVKAETLDKDMIVIFHLVKEPPKATTTTSSSSSPPGEGEGGGAEPQDDPSGPSDVEPDHSAGGGGFGPGGTPPPPPPPPPSGWVREWQAPVQVSLGGNEPHVVVDSTGNIYYAPTSELWKSTDGGLSWTNVSPGPPVTAPTLGSDDSVSVAPDDSVWYSRYIGYPDNTIGCTSTDGAATWTCNNGAVAGITDRMWIVGLSATTGIVESGEALSDPQWAKTTDGSLTYLNCATSSFITQHGNMAYDRVNDKVWEVTHASGKQALMRIDGPGRCNPPGLGSISPTATTVTQSIAIPWLTIYSTATQSFFWTSGNPIAADGSGQVVAARSLDEGATWTTYPIATTALSSTFSYSGAGPPGYTGTQYAVVAYYGSDSPGDPATDNMGSWSLHVAWSENADGAAPTWDDDVVIPLVHNGNICLGLNCESGGADPSARYSGDLIGCWVDGEGLAHVAYQDDTAGGSRAMYVRQQWVFY